MVWVYFGRYDPDTNSYVYDYNNVIEMKGGINEVRSRLVRRFKDAVRKYPRGYGFRMAGFMKTRDSPMYAWLEVSNEDMGIPPRTGKPVAIWSIVNPRFPEGEPLEWYYVNNDGTLKR